MSAGRPQLELFGRAEPDAPEANAADGIVTASEGADLPDAAARAAIVTRLESNILVEAGAGAGKTRAMVGRMIALVRGGVSIERIAAVTFTRKAAAELRERLQTALEADLAAVRATDDLDRITRLDAALRAIDRGFAGTIHSFCARLLRERAIDARLDPGFREMFGPEESRQRRTFWTTHAERLTA
ncbi:MAG: UvrD-helicase domain-containing protein, partial [Longimicrobiales bacterium]